MLCSTTEEPSAHTARRKTTPRSNTLARGHLNKTHEIVCKINVFGYKYGGRGQCTPANHHPPPPPQPAQLSRARAKQREGRGQHRGGGATAEGGGARAPPGGGALGGLRERGAAPPSASGAAARHHVGDRRQSTEGPFAAC